MMQIIVYCLERESAFLYTVLIHSVIARSTTVSKELDRGKEGRSHKFHLGKIEIIQCTNTDQACDERLILSLNKPRCPQSLLSGVSKGCLGVAQDCRLTVVIVKVT